MKYHYVKIKIFTITTITDAYYAQAKRFSKDFEINIQENIMICMFKAIHCC